MTIDEARAKAHQQYDDCMFCPGCSKLLTGLHMGAGATPTGLRERHNRSSKIRRKDMAGGNEDPIIIGLAIAVIIGIGIVRLIDALRNKLK